MTNARKYFQSLVWSRFLVFLRILLKPSIQAKTHYTKESLSKDTSIHLAHTFATVDEDNRYLFDFKSYLMRSELHLDLESISFETNFIQFDGFQHLATIANESCRCIVHLESCNQTNILGRKITHKDTTDWPINHIDARNIARTYCNIIPFIMSSSIKTWQIIRIMTEVGIHLEDEVIALLQRPFEAHDISSAQAQLTRTLQDMETVGKLIGLQLLNDVCCSVRTTVIDNKDVEFLLQAKNGTDDSFSLYVGMITILSLIMF